MKVRGINCRYLGLIYWWCLQRESLPMEKTLENEKEDKGKEKEDKGREKEEDKGKEKENEKEDKGKEKEEDKGKEKEDEEEDKEKGKDGKKKKKKKKKERNSQEDMKRANYVKMLVAVELVARAVKIALNRQLSWLQNATEIDVKKTCCEYFVKLSQDQFWEDELLKTFYHWFGPAAVVSAKSIRQFALSDLKTVKVLLTRLSEMTGTHWDVEAFEKYPKLSPKNIINVVPKVKLLNQLLFENADYVHTEHMTLFRLFVDGQFIRVTYNWDHLCKMWFNVLDAKPLDLRGSLKLGEAVYFAFKSKSLSKLGSIVRQSKDAQDEFDVLSNTMLFLYQMMLKYIKQTEISEKTDDKATLDEFGWDKIFGSNIDPKSPSDKQTPINNTENDDLENNSKAIDYKGLFYSTYASFLVKIQHDCKDHHTAQKLKKSAAKYFAKSLNCLKESSYLDQIEILLLNAIHSNTNSEMHFKHAATMMSFEQKSKNTKNRSNYLYTK